MTNDNKVFTREYYLTPGECNSEEEMPIWLLANRIIEVATLHANSWGIGYKRLKLDNQAWVLSRIAIEMKEYPKVGENYTLSTWIESFNRHFSERNVEIRNESGDIIGYARTIWVVINTSTRESCDISALEFIKDNATDRPCPIDKQSRIKTVEHRREGRYRFMYTDIDFNRHVNTIRYICSLLNQWDLSFFDNHTIRRFEISFMKETYANTEVVIGIDDTNPLDCTAEIVDGATPLCKARVVFEERSNQK